MARLPPYLVDLQLMIERHALDFKLDFFDTIFEIVDYRRINEVAAYGGFPVRYPHWRFGMDYERLIKSHTYGFSQIYEMVINNDPCYAYLLEGNSLVDQKLVMCHVLGHNDFFKNNYYFSVTNRKMVDEMANHATRIRRYMERYGVDEVERFVDVCLSLENLIDPMGQYIRRHRPVAETEAGGEDQPEVAPGRITASKRYMEKYINPPEFLADQKKRQDEDRERQKRFPAEPEADVYSFVMRHAPLSKWQRNTMEIIFKEALYFVPQKMTKIMNEGWATYWHSRMMTERVLDDAEAIEYARVTAGVTASAPGNFNPYKMGLELFRHIEERWNRGMFGKEWEECDDMMQRLDWNQATGLGQEKIFQVRRIYNDVTFIDEFFTEEFCRQHMYYTFGFNNRSDRWEIESRAFQSVKQKLLFQLTNFGQPYIVVEDANYGNRGDLLLRHRHEGMDLKKDYARDTLENLFKIWGRSVFIMTKQSEKDILLGYDGTEHLEKSVQSA